APAARQSLGLPVVGTGTRTMRRQLGQGACLPASLLSNWTCSMQFGHSAVNKAGASTATAAGSSASAATASDSTSGAGAAGVVLVRGTWTCFLQALQTTRLPARSSLTVYACWQWEHLNAMLMPEPRDEE